MYFDLDLTKDEKASGILVDWGMVKSALKQDSRIYACWFSVSGAGVGGLVRFEGLNAENWLTNWFNLSQDIFELTKRENDSQTKNINRASFISYDPEIYINLNSEKIEAISAENSQVNSKVLKHGRLSGRIEGNENRAPFFTPLFGFEIDPDIYFSESFIDLHFTKELSKVNIDGINAVYDGHGHYWFKNGFPYARLTGRNRPIMRGSRNKELVKTLSTLCFLNPHWSELRLKNWLFSFHKDWCPDPLHSSELERIFDYVYYDCLHGNKLIPNIKHKKNHFCFQSKLHKSEKLSKVGQAKAFVTREMAIKAIEKCMRDRRQISISAIATLTGKSEPTVIKTLRTLNKQAANDYIQKVLSEAKQYEGVIIEILPNFKKIIIPEKPDSSS